MSIFTKYTVKIENLEVYAYHGLNPEEQELGQRFLFNIYMQILGDQAVESEPGSEDIEQTVNYSKVSKFVCAWNREHKCELIETAAASVCREILLNFDTVYAVTVEIKKPHAPIREMHFDYVSVEKSLAWHDVYLSLGSNSEDKNERLEQALKELSGIPGIRIILKSDTHSYPAVGQGYEGIFLNNAVYIKTFLSPKELFITLRESERRLGRDRSKEKGIRSIDIDILMYESITDADDCLILPYPDFEDQRYTLEPMCEIAPNLYHPVLMKTMKQLLNELQAEENKHD